MTRSIEQRSQGSQPCSSNRSKELNEPILLDYVRPKEPTPQTIAVEGSIQGSQLLMARAAQRQTTREPFDGHAVTVASLDAFGCDVNGCEHDFFPV